MQGEQEIKIYLVIVSSIPWAITLMCWNLGWMRITEYALGIASAFTILSLTKGSPLLLMVVGSIYEISKALDEKKNKKE